MFSSGPFHQGFNPYLHSSFLPDRRQYYFDPRREQLEAARQRENVLRARALAEQRARRAQWLPDEDEDENSDEDWEDMQLGPRERVYVDALRRQRQLEQQKEREEARRNALEEQRRQEQLEEGERRQRDLEEQRKAQQEQQEQARARNVSPNHIPIDEPEARVSPQPEPSRGPTPRPQYNETHEEAASRIQKSYRIHRSLRSIQGSGEKFKESKVNFIFPTTIDFQQPDGGHITVEAHHPLPLEENSDIPTDIDSQPSGKLAYSSNNFTLHAYMENLSKLLIQLDGVESWGDANVRKRRRGVVKKIEEELSRVDTYCRIAWGDYVQERSQRGSAPVDS